MNRHGHRPAGGGYPVPPHGPPWPVGRLSRKGLAVPRAQVAAAEGGYTMLLADTQESGVFERQAREQIWVDEPGSR